MKERLARFWQGPAGGREVLAVGYPLILGHLSITIQSFVDRVFLTWYGPEAVAGAVTAGFSTWSLFGLFLGCGEYLTTFIAQYHGAGRPERIGPALWQGIYFSALAGALVAGLSPLAVPFFALVGHQDAVQQHEIAYAGILMRGTLPTVLMATLSTFFAGRGQTKPILLVNVLVTLVNVGLDYAWIFGHWGFPAAGSAGAARATVASQAVGCAAYLSIIWGPTSRRAYRTLAGWRFDAGLFWRLLRFGMPTGFQFAIEIFAFALFLMIVGRISTAALAASGIAFNLNMLVFMPMVGLGIGVSSLVGRYLGGDRPDLAERATWSAFQVSFAYMALCSLAYLLLPGLLLAPYRAGSSAAAFAEVGEIATVLLRFVAFYSIFDMASVIFSAGLKGAGDTAYPMRTTAVLAWVAMLGPAYVGCVLLPGGVYLAWSTATAYVLLLGLLMLRRFRAGGWKSLRVIEPPARTVSPEP